MGLVLENTVALHIESSTLELVPTNTCQCVSYLWLVAQSIHPLKSLVKSCVNCIFFCLGSIIFFLLILSATFLSIFFCWFGVIYCVVHLWRAIFLSLVGHWVLLEIFLLIGLYKVHTIINFSLLWSLVSLKVFFLHNALRLNQFFRILWWWLAGDFLVIFSFLCLSFLKCVNIAFGISMSFMDALCLNIDVLLIIYLQS